MARINGVFLPVRDEACRGALGDYYLNVYDVAGPNDPHVHQIHLGKDPLAGSEDALARADEFIGSLVAEDQFSFHKDITACGASVIRLCTSHDEPVLEIADNVLRVLPGQVPRGVVPNRAYEAGTLAVVYTRLEPTEADERSYLRELQPIHYLPREDYAATSQPHTSVVVNTGGRSYAARFGLLGGEDTVIFEPAPYIDLD